MNSTLVFSLVTAAGMTGQQPIPQVPQPTVNLPQSYQELLQRQQLERQLFLQQQQQQPQIQPQQQGQIPLQVPGVLPQAPEQQALPLPYGVQRPNLGVPEVLPPEVVPQVGQPQIVRPQVGQPPLLAKPVVQPVFSRVPTHYEFAKCFVPVPGYHRVKILHPRTKCPVQVCFKLPACACPPKVRVGRRSIEYDYGDLEVEIKFRLFGRVTVDYDD